MTGPSPALDPRNHAVRRDLADRALAGRVIAPHYASPVRRSCGAHAAFVRRSPSDEAEAVTELLPGEAFEVLEYAAGWAWGYCGADRLVGYVEAIALACPTLGTHIVCEKCAPVAADDSIISPVLAHLPMGSRLCGKEIGACLATEYGCVSLAHLRRFDEHDEDPVVVAERLIGTPYLPGGRSFGGIDSPGLIQLALSLCGHESPRLPEEQRRLGIPLPQGAPLRRGDLILFDGDGGLMVDDLLMIHACPMAGKVTVDPVAIIDRPGMERRRLAL